MGPRASMDINARAFACIGMPMVNSNATLVTAPTISACCCSRSNLMPKTART